MNYENISKSRIFNEYADKSDNRRTVKAHKENNRYHVVYPCGDTCYFPTYLFHHNYELIEDNGPQPNFYPEDGGLGQPFRSFEDTPSLTNVVGNHFAELPYMAADEILDHLEDVKEMFEDDIYIWVDYVNTFVDALEILELELFDNYYFFNMATEIIDVAQDNNDTIREWLDENHFADEVTQSINNIITENECILQHYLSLFGDIENA